MKIILAKNIGFCGGVQRAFDQVEKSFQPKTKRKKVFVLGSLAHNRGVEKRIDQLGIKRIKNLRLVGKGDVVIITAHGASQETYKKIKAKGAKVFDTTCVNVKKVQKIAGEYSRKGYRVIIFGDKDHKEVKGILGHIRGRAEVVADLAQARALLKKLAKIKSQKRPLVLISQTTKNINIFEQIRKEFEKFAQEAKRKHEVFDTICRAPYVRQKEAERFAKDCQLSVVIGGGESANTKRLWQICRKGRGPVFWIKEVREKLLPALVRQIERLKKTDKICVISGASTPPWEIETVRKQLEQLTR